MDLVRGHIVAASVVVLVAAAVGTVFLFARPAYHRHVNPAPPDTGLSYTAVEFSAADARDAFKTQGIELAARSQTPTIATLGNAGDILEVDVFGERAKVEAAGFSDYGTDATGNYVRFPSDCSSGKPGVASSYDAELWHGNVRVIVNCGTAGKTGPAWLQRAQLALAHL